MKYGSLIYNEIKKDETLAFLDCSCLGGFVRNGFVYCWCGLFYKLIFLMRLSYSVSFSVYMKIFQRDFLHVRKMSRSVNNFRTKYICYWYFRR